MIKSYTVVFLAGNFLFTSSDTFAVGCICLATKHIEETSQFGVWMPPPCDIKLTCLTNKMMMMMMMMITSMKTASPQRHRRDAATASSWRFGSAAIPYVVRSTIGLLRDSYAQCH